MAAQKKNHDNDDFKRITNTQKMIVHRETLRLHK